VRHCTLLPLVAREGSSGYIAQAAMHAALSANTVPQLVVIWLQYAAHLSAPHTPPPSTLACGQCKLGLRRAAEAW